MRKLRYGSVCSGIESVTVAWHDLDVDGLGLEPAWFAEVDPFCCSLLSQKYPQVPNLGDITKDDFDARAARLGPIDILVGGTPCTGFSSAGRRGGLDDPRSALALSFVRIAEALKPKIFLWENVPGVFTTNGGRDFGAFLGRLQDAGFRELAWRVIDSRWTGVPQSRRRVFLVGHSGTESVPRAVLFIPEGQGGHPTPRRRSRKKTAAAAGTGAPVRASADATAVFRKAMKPHNKEEAERWEEDQCSGTLNCFDEGRDLPGHIVVETVPFNVNSAQSCAREDHAFETETSRCLDTNGGFASGQGGTVVVATAEVASTLQGGGRRGHRIDAEGAAGGHLVVEVMATGETASALTSSGGGADDNDGQANHLVVGRVVEVSEAYQCHGSNVGPMGVLRAGNGNETGGVPFIAEAIAFTDRGRGDSQQTECSDIAFCLTSPNGGGRSDDRQVAYRLLAFGQYADDDLASTMQSRDYKGATDLVVNRVRYIVRRFTPVEAERLQGFPDNWTLIKFKGRVKKEHLAEVVAYLRDATGEGWTEDQVLELGADSHRYRTLGNAISIPPLRWLGQRILRVWHMLERGEEIPGEMP